MAISALTQSYLEFPEVCLVVKLRSVIFIKRGTYILFSISFLIQSSFSYEVVWLNLEERGDHVLVHLHYDAQVVEVAVICRREDRHQVPSREELVPVLLHLVCAAYQVQVVLLIEVLHDYFAERVGNSAVILAPINDVLLGVRRIRPEQVAEESAIGHVGWPQYLVDLLQIIELGRQAAMNTEYLIVDYGGHRKAIEALDELLPEPQRVAALAFVVKAVDPINRAALMIASQQEEVLRILDLVGEQKADYFQVLLAPVDVVAQEQIVGLRWEVADLKYPEQVDVLAVDVARDYQRHVELQEIRLADEDLLALLYEHLNLRLFQGHRLDPEVRGVGANLVSDVEQRVYYCVKLRVVHLHHASQGVR